MLSQEDIQTKYLRTITTLCESRFSTYFESDCYRGLKNRCTLIDDAIDLRFKNTEAFISEIAPPIINKDYRETNAFLVKYFENDPVTSFRAIGATPKENADNAQALINVNYMNTRFREECLLWVFDNLARYGTAIVFSQFNNNYRGAGLQTVHRPNADSPYPRLPMAGKQAVCNWSIHPLNYFQDPRGNSMGKSYYQGFIDQWYFSDLMKYINNDLYIQENLLKVIKECKGGQSENFWWGGKRNEKRDYSRAVVTPVRMYTLLNFDGNENDDTIYYVEMINSKPIRIQPLDVNGGFIPLNTGVFMARPDVWWGNSSIDYKIPFQNLKNWLINSQVESTMKQMDRMVLVRRGGGLNVADINNRHQFGGIVFYEGAEDPSKLMFPVQFNDSSLNGLESLNRDVNQMIQEISPVVNLQNKYNQGGLNNSTLGAAQMAAGIGEVIFGYSMKNVGYLISKISEVNLALLTQNLPDLIRLKKSDYESEIEIEKRDFLGEFVVKAESSLIVNEQIERMNTANIINQALNWLGTGRPEFQTLNVKEFIKDWARAWIGQAADLTKYYNDNPQQQAPAAGQPNAPQGPAMAPPQGGVPNVPQAPQMPSGPMQMAIGGGT